MTARVLTVRALAALATLLLATACGSASAPSPPTGVDQLTIPTPSPEAGDFAADVDNPWFPLPPGRTWTYDVADARGTHALVVRVAPGPTVAGVATTARVAVEQGRTTTDWYAEDRAGNVWWLGRDGVWQAGVEGAEAGLAMPAGPRVGDGFRAAYLPGVVEDAEVVVSRTATAEVPAGSYADVLELSRRSRLDQGSLTRRFARDVGLVEEETVGGIYRAVRLRSVAG